MAQPGCGYRISSRSPLGQSLKKAAVTEARRAAWILRQMDLPQDVRIHETRKSLKRVRTVLRLAAGCGPEEVEDAARSLVRLASRQLAPLRDRDILPEAVTTLLTHSGRAEDAPRINDRLFSGQKHRQADPALDHTRLERGHETLLFLINVLGQWELPAGEIELIEDNLRRLYRRGRRLARQETLTAEQLHDLRKRVKDLHHLAQLLAGADAERLEVRELFKVTKGLGDHLGEHQDLVVLEAELAGRQEELSPFHELLELSTARRSQLASKALPLARQLFNARPGHFSRCFFPDYCTAFIPAGGDAQRTP